MPPELSRLPVVRAMEQDESGCGFLLRCAHANGIAIRQLMQVAGVRMPTWPRPPEVERLAFLADVAPARLSLVLRQRRTQFGRREFEFAGHRWMSVTALRVRTLQVCPCCLKERGYCRAAWELVGYTICFQHGCLLLDGCPHCARPIDWARPAVDVCRCGHYLATVGLVAEIPAGVRDWCRWLEQQCELPSSGTWEPPSRLNWLAHAGPDAAFHVLMALGARRDAVHHRTVSDTVRVATPAAMTQCLARALRRVTEIDPGNDPLPIDLVRVIDQPRLERLARFGVLESGRRIAQQLLRRMRRETPLALLRHPWRAAPVFKGQLDLFADGDAQAS